MNSVDFTSSGNFENGILDCFPFYKYDIRDAQRELLTGIESAIQKGKNVIIIQAPTGVGKSAISYAVLRYSDDGYVCTGTKALQEQYLADFEALLTVKGRSNYDCLESTKLGVKCDKGQCQVIEGYKCNRKPSLKKTDYPAYFSKRDNLLKYWYGNPKDPVRCPYMAAKAAALNNFAVIHNYKYILTEANFIGEFTKRKVMISDEGHNIESQIIDFIKVPITKKILDTVNRYHTINPIDFAVIDKKCDNAYKLKFHASWLMDLNIAIVNALEKIKLLYEQVLQEKLDLETEYKWLKLKSSVEDEEKRDLADRIDAKNLRLNDLLDDRNKLENLQNHQIAFFLKDISEHLDNWVVLESFTNLGAISKIEFQPIFISQYALGKYFRLGEINIIMSATILDYKKVLLILGYLW